MKIIPNQHKKSTGNITGKDVTLVKGSKFSAKVISVAGNNITVEIDAKSGKLKVSGVIQNGHSLNENSLTNLEVLGSKNGKNLFSDLGQSNAVNQKPDLSGIHKNITVNNTSLSGDELKILTSIFKEKGIPISKGNMKLIADNKGFAEKVESLLKENNIQVAGKEMPKLMKQVILDYFKGPVAGNKASSNVSSEISKIELSGAIKSADIDKVISMDTKEPEKTSVVKGLNSETVVKTETDVKSGVLTKGGQVDQSEKDVSVLSHKVEGKVFKTTEATVGDQVVIKPTGDGKTEVIEKNVVFQKEVMKLLSDDVKATLSSSNKLESLSMLLKNNMSFTLKNMVVSEKVLIGEKEIKSQLDDIKSMLPKAVGLSMKALAIDQLVDHKEINNYYKELLNSLEKTMIDHNLQGDSKLESKVEILRNTISFMNESEGQYNFMQMPIDLNNRQANLSIAFKKEENGKKKVDKNNAVIFISLDTNNLELIQSKIVVKKSHLDINVRVLTEGIKEVILEQLPALEEALNERSFASVALSVTVNQSKKNFFQMLTEEEQIMDNNFDIRV